MNNTSLGVTADSTGNFYVKDVPVHFTDLVFSFIGYESLVARISLTPGKVLNIYGRLKPSAQQLNEVVVKSSRGFLWKKDFERFKKQLLGASQNFSSCEIVNAGGLHFLSTPHSFSASATRPLEIINHALGYRIQLSLQSFEVTESTYKILYFAHFTDLVAKNDREKFRWELNRLNSYKGSLRHFVRSLIHGRSRAEGFAVYYNEDPPSRNNAVRQNLRIVPPERLAPRGFGENQNQFEVLENATYEIHYINKRMGLSKSWYSGFPHPVSWLVTNEKSLHCRANGMLAPNSKCVVSGSMNEYRIADALPEDYDPDQVLKTIFNANRQNLEQVTGEVTDSSSLLPIIGAKAFINNSLFKTETDSNGRFKLRNIPTGVYDLVIAKTDYPPVVRRIAVKAGQTAVKVQLDLKQPEYWKQNKEDDRKKDSFIRRYLANSSLIAVGNPTALEMKRGTGNSSFRTKGPLRIIDKQNGYAIDYYLNAATISTKEKKNNSFIAFSSFDTLSPSSPQQKDHWQNSRKERYRTSFNHFIKSLVEGRTKEGGFEILYSSGESKRKKSRTQLAGDSLLKMSTKQDFFELTFPKNIVIHAEGEKDTWITSNSAVHVSNSGILGTAAAPALILTGPMKEKEIRSLPLEYLPPYETFTSPKAWAVVSRDQLKEIDHYREKPFLHTDKGYYYPGEKIWFKAYLNYNFWQFKDSLSKVLHVQLINSKRNIVRNSVLRIEDGVAWGDFALPDTLQSGNYYLRAYTEWSLNFGTEDIFLQLVPILAVNQNIEGIKDKGLTEKKSPLKVIIDCDRPDYRPREKISIHIRISGDSDTSINSNLSMSVTDADKISRAFWVSSILEDSIKGNKKDQKTQRLIYSIEKDFVYRSRLDDAQKEGTVFVFLKNQGLSNAQMLPINKGRFTFPVDFYDTASLYFHPYLKSGAFGGKVYLDKPFSPPVVLPISNQQFTFHADDALSRIKYSGNPAENYTVLKEVIVRGTKTAKASLYAHASISGARLDSLKRYSDTNGFVCALASAAGGRCVITLEETYLEFFGRRAAVVINGTLWNNFDAVIPEEVVNVDIYRNPAAISFRTSKTQHNQSRSKEMNLFRLQGYAAPSTFYVPDHSQESLNDEHPDFRTTIYWNPSLAIPNDGADVSFYAADFTGRYRIVVQGFSDEGTPIYGEQIIEVRK